MRSKKCILLTVFFIAVFTIIFIFKIGVTHARPKLLHVTTMRGHNAIYDPVNKQIIVFGGSYGNSPTSDTSVFDMEKKEWKKIETEEAPPERFATSVIYDPTGKQMIVFGGWGKTGPLSDIWLFDIEPLQDNSAKASLKKKWKEIETEDAPTPRAFHTAIYDSANKQMIIFGGSNERREFFSDTWAYDIAKKTWKEIPSADETPPGRCCHSAVYDSENKRMIIFGGGNDKGQLSDVWTFDIEKKTWQEIEPQEETDARWDHSTIYDPVNKQMLVFGGNDDDLQPLTSISVFDTVKKKWDELPSAKESPPEMSFHSSVYDSESKQMIVIGESIEEVDLLEIWLFHIENKTWEKIKIR